MRAYPRVGATIHGRARVHWHLRIMCMHLGWCRRNGSLEGLRCRRHCGGHALARHGSRPVDEVDDLPAIIRLHHHHGGWWKGGETHGQVRVRVNGVRCAKEEHVSCGVAAFGHLDAPDGEA